MDKEDCDSLARRIEGAKDRALPHGLIETGTSAGDPMPYTILYGRTRIGKNTVLSAISLYFGKKYRSASFSASPRWGNK
jgi:hypothetical protein